MGPLMLIHLCHYDVGSAEAVGVKAELYPVMHINLLLCCVCAACPSRYSNNLFNFCTQGTSLPHHSHSPSSSSHFPYRWQQWSPPLPHIPKKYIFLLLMYLTQRSPTFFLALSSPLGSFCAGRGCRFLSISLSLLIPSINLPDSHQTSPPSPQLPAWTLQTKKEEITSETGFIRDFLCL